MNDLHPKQKGNLTELQCITAFYEAGYQVSLPYGENSRYDLVADINGHLLKVQVKTSRTFDENSFIFTCRSTKSKKSGNTRRAYTKDEIDYFATFYQGKCYLVPVEECGVEKRLHLFGCKSNQSMNVSYAKDYELLTQLKCFEE